MIRNLGIALRLAVAAVDLADGADPMAQRLMLPGDAARLAAEARHDGVRTSP